MLKIKSIKNVNNLFGKVIFLRSDFNVPIQNGVIKEDFKIISGLATIRFLLRYKCKIIIATHLDPEGGKNIKKYSTEPVAKRLAKLLNRKVEFVNDCIGPKVKPRFLILLI